MKSIEGRVAIVTGAARGIGLATAKKLSDAGARVVINDLDEAWAPVHRVDAQYLRTEINPQFVGVVPPSDVIIATTFEVEFESASGTIMLVVPYSTIEPIKQKLASNYQTDNEMADSIWTAAMNYHLLESKTNITVKLGETEMNVGDLITLEKGDIIPLNQEVAGSVSLEVEGVEKMKCLMGLHKGSRAVQVVKVNED